jgi:glycosyltransferase involved in cell wall biosynthesis
MKVCMFVLNNCERDSRVLKEARTLTDVGHDVRIIAILDKDTEPYEEREGFRIIRVALDPVTDRIARAIMRAEDSAYRLAIRPAAWSYHQIRRLSGLFRRSAEPADVLVRHKSDEPSTAVPHEAEQPPTSVSHNVGGLVWLAHRRLRLSLYRILGSASRPLDRPLRLLDYCGRSWMVIKGEPADVYHSHDLDTLLAAYVAKRRTGGRLVYDSHELFTEQRYIPRVERLLFRLVERFLIHRVDAVVTVNAFVANELSKRYRIGPPLVVMNCSPLARQSGKQDGSSLRRALGLDDAVPIIVHVGKFNSDRGSEKLVSAVPCLKRGVIVFLGWSDKEGGLRELVSEKGLAGRVFFAPPVAPDHVVSHIRSAQVGVMPFLDLGLSYYYATPNKLWECIGAGLPIVCSDFPAVKSIVEGYHLGRTCNPEDPADIAAAINWVLADRGRYEEMKANALEAAKIFNWENESRKLLDVYRQLDRGADHRMASERLGSALRDRLP